MSKWVAALVLLMGLWLFLGPFLAPVIGLSRPATQSGPTMAGMGGGMGSMGGMATKPTKAIVIDRSTLAFNFIPGPMLVLIGVFYLFRERPLALE